MAQSNSIEEVVMEVQDGWRTLPRAPLFGVFGLLIGLAAGFALGTYTTAATIGSTASDLSKEDSRPIEVDASGSPSRGPETARVVVVEFTDYQCPFCKQHFQQAYDSVLSAYEGRIRYVVRNFPVTSIHPLALKAAEAAECADDQGQFWPFHDLLFQRSPQLSADSLKVYAARTGLDVRRFRKCLEGGEKKSAVARDTLDGTKYGVRGTPTFFINGRRVIGAQPVSAFRSYIDAALKDAPIANAAAHQ